jgi:hypothetical protein
MNPSHNSLLFSFSFWGRDRSAKCCWSRSRRRTHREKRNKGRTSSAHLCLSPPSRRERKRDSLSSASSGRERERRRTGTCLFVFLGHSCDRRERGNEEVEIFLKKEKKLQKNSAEEMKEEIAKCFGVHIWPIDPCFRNRKFGFILAFCLGPRSCSFQLPFYFLNNLSYLGFLRTSVRGAASKNTQSIWALIIHILLLVLGNFISMGSIITSSCNLSSLGLMERCALLMTQTKLKIRSYYDLEKL